MDCTFETLVGLLTIVQSWGQAVNAEIGVGNEDWFAPFSSLDGVAGFDMTVDLTMMSVLIDRKELGVKALPLSLTAIPSLFQSEHVSLRLYTRMLEQTDDLPIVSRGAGGNILMSIIRDKIWA